MIVRKRPCAECPWVKTTDPGQFPRERYDALAHTTGQRGREAPLFAPMFACHKSADGKEMPCAGWLAAVGYESLTVRYYLAQNEIPKSAMAPGDDWPELFSSYTEMADRQAGDFT